MWKQGRGLFCLLEHLCSVQGWVQHGDSPTFPPGAHCPMGDRPVPRLTPGVARLGQGPSGQRSSEREPPQAAGGDLAECVAEDVGPLQSLAVGS